MRGLRVEEERRAGFEQPLSTPSPRRPRRRGARDASPQLGLLAARGARRTTAATIAPTASTTSWSIYEENHSFDNVYGGWHGVNGLAAAAHPDHPAARPPVPAAGRREPRVAAAAGRPAAAPTTRAFPRVPECPVPDRRLHPPEDTTCPVPGAPPPNGVPNAAAWPAAARATSCTGTTRSSTSSTTAKDRYTTGSDAVGLTMGTYDTRRCRSTGTCTAGAPHYAIADDFFQAAFGGSFLNHQWLIAASTPTWPGALATAAPTTCIRWSTPTASRTSSPLYPATPAYEGRRPLTACPAQAARRRPAAAGRRCAATTPSTRSSRPISLRARHARRPPAAAQTRRPSATDSARRRRPLGLVLRWLVQRQRRRRRPRLDQRHGRHLHRPGTPRGRGVPELSGQAVPVPPPAVQLLRQLRARHRRPRSPPSGRAGVHRRGSKRGHLRRSASSSRSAPRTSTPATPASTPGAATWSTSSRRSSRPGRATDTLVIVTYDEYGGQWDHVAPPARCFRRQRPVGPGDPDPGAARLAGAAAPVRRGPDRARHDLDPRHHRALFRLPPLTTRDAAVADLFGVFRARAPH